MSQVLNETLGGYSHHSGSYEDELMQQYEEATPYVNTSALGAPENVAVYSNEGSKQGSSHHSAEYRNRSEERYISPTPSIEVDLRLSRLSVNTVPSTGKDLEVHAAVKEFDERSQHQLVRLNTIMSNKQCTSEELHTVKSVLEALSIQRAALLQEIEQNSNNSNHANHGTKNTKKSVFQRPLTELHIDTSIPHEDYRTVNASPPCYYRPDEQKKTIVKPLTIQSSASTQKSRMKAPLPPKMVIAKKQGQTQKEAKPTHHAPAMMPQSTKSCPPVLRSDSTDGGSSPTAPPAQLNRRLSQISISSSGTATSANLRNPRSSPSNVSHKSNTSKVSNTSKISNFSTGGVVLSEKNQKHLDKLLQKQKKPWVSNFAQTPSLVNGLFGQPPSVNQFRIRAAARRALKQFTKRHGEAALCEDRGRLHEYLFGARVVITGMDERVSRRKQKLQGQLQQIRAAADQMHENHGLHEWWFQVPEEGSTKIKCMCGNAIEKQTIVVWRLLLSLVDLKPSKVVFSREAFLYALSILPMYALHLHLSEDRSLESLVFFFASFCWCKKTSIVSQLSTKQSIPTALLPLEEKRTVARPSVSGSVMLIDQVVPVEPPRNIQVALSLANNTISLQSVPTAWSTRVETTKHAPSVSLTRTLTRPVAQTLLSHLLYTHTDMLLVIAGEAIKRGTKNIIPQSPKADLSKRIDRFTQCLKCGLVSTAGKNAIPSGKKQIPKKAVSTELLDLVTNNEKPWEESSLHAFLCDTKGIKAACHIQHKSVCKAWDIDSSRVFYVTCVCEGNKALRNKNNMHYCHQNCNPNNSCHQSTYVHQEQSRNCFLEYPTDTKKKVTIDYVVEEPVMHKPVLKPVVGKENINVHPFTNIQILPPNTHIPGNGVHPSPGLPMGNRTLIPKPRLERFENNMYVNIHVKTDKQDTTLPRKSPEEILPLHRTSANSLLFAPSMGRRAEVYVSLKKNRNQDQHLSPELQEELRSMQEEDAAQYTDERLRHYFLHDEQKIENLGANGHAYSKTTEFDYLPDKDTISSEITPVSPSNTEKVLRIDQIYPAFGGNNADENAVRQSIQKQMLNSMQTGGIVNVQDPRFLPLAANRNYAREGYLTGSCGGDLSLKSYEYGEDADIQEKYQLYPSANNIREPVYHSKRVSSAHIDNITSATSPPSFYTYEHAHR